MKIQFGNRDAALVAGILRDPDTREAIRECFANNVGVWAWPAKLQRYDEALIRETLAFMGVRVGEEANDQ